MTPRRNALLYVAFGFAWILLSDRLLSHLQLSHSWEILKGLGFVVATGVLVYLISRRFLNQVRRESEAARQADEKFRLSVEKAPVGIAIVLGDRLKYLNPTALAYFGIPHLAAETELLSRFGITTDHLTATPAEIECTRADGKMLPLTALGIPIEFEGQPAKLVFLRDISEEKNRQQWLESLANSVPAIVWVSNRDGLDIFRNRQWDMYCGLEPGESSTEAIHPDDREATTESWIRAVATRQPFESQMRLRGVDGAFRWHMARALPVHDASGELAYWFGVTIDIEDNVRASLNLERVREAERVRIARELHDDLAQSLVTAKLQLEMAECADCSENGTLAKAKNQISRALQSTRSLSTMLRPPILDQVGLAGALEWLCSDFEKRTNLVCTPQLERDAVAAFESAESRIAIFRTMQEALTNVARHSQATEVTLAATRHGGKVLFQVKDNGVGFDAAKPILSLGLTGVRERARLIGAMLEISSAPGEGTTVRLEVPVHIGAVTRT